MSKLLKIPILVISALFVALAFTPVSASLPTKIGAIEERGFTTPKGLEKAVGFWKKVYTEYTTRHAIIHDSENLDVIYEVVYLGDKRVSSRTRDRKVGPVKRKYIKMLRKLAKRKGTLGLNAEERRIANMVRGSYYRAARNIRVQIGQKDRFREGIKRSGRYMEGIKRAFRKHNLPEELTVLPHVESSFQVNAYSSAGAAGVWQFTRRTGKRFMKIGYSVDERRDPILAADAAARLLKYNFGEVNSWPLAITAYNHGINGMKRAKRKYGNNIAKIVKHYQSRTFGFASRNFYAEFLAALEVSRNYKKYFPKVRLDKPIRTKTVVLKEFIHINTLVSRLGMTRDEIAEYNPSLRQPVISGKRRLPKFFKFQAPGGKYSDLAQRVASIPKVLKYDRQVRARWYTIQRGDTLSDIARRMGTTVRKLKSANHIDNKNRIYKGQVLEMPGGAKGGTSTKRVASRKSFSRKLDWDKSVAYKVRRNDSLYKISRRLGVPIQELIRANRILNPNRLRPGQVLKVPAVMEVAKLDPQKKGKSKTGDRNKVSLTVKDVPETKKTVVASAAPQVREQGKGKIKIEFSDPASASEHFNKNRPAFTPILLNGKMHKNGRVGTMTIDFDETLSHIADWAKISVRELRRFNNLKRRAQLNVHQKIKIPFYKTDPEGFEEKRQEYHRAIQEDFFNNYRVEKVVIRNVKKGETLWEICNEIYVIPFWLLGNYNPEKDIHSLSEGEPIMIPMITAIKA